MSESTSLENVKNVGLVDFVSLFLVTVGANFSTARLMVTKH